MINIKKLLPIIIICLFTLQCEQGWLEDIIDPTVEGCNVNSACNYDPNVTDNDGSCDFSSCMDCLGYPHGVAVLDSCSTCDASPLNDCTQDCGGIWGGTAVVDNCENCSASNITCEQDCLGTWGGSAVVDSCAVCDGDTFSINDCAVCDAGLTLGCDGICSATPAENDACDICGGDGTQCQDCAGTVNGSATTDNCGTCDADSSNDCTQDCNGIWSGSAVLDNCGECGGDGSSCETIDCTDSTSDYCLDLSVLQEFIDNSQGGENPPPSDLNPLNLGVQTWTNGRLESLCVSEECNITYKLSGNIPATIGSLTNLVTLNLMNNNLTGQIPSGIGNLTNLTGLMLHQNQLHGQIPAGIGNLINLEDLNLRYNELTGEIPTEIGNLTKLFGLSLQYNNLSGGIPSEIGNLVNSTGIRLDNNNLSGQIPAGIGNLTKLTRLLLDSNELTGEIPSGIGSLVNLTELRLNNNQLSGGIPTEIENLVNLNGLYLSDNNLTGGIPSEIGNLVNLTELRLNGNNLSGSIPSEIGNLINLQHLHISQNDFSGSIPSEIGNLTNLQQISLQDCKLTGSIPESIGNLANLIYLGLYNNQLSGQVPENICDIYSDLNNFNLTNNNLCPPYPSCLTEEDIGTQDISECPVQDCAGTWGGGAVVDCAGVCGGTNFDTNSDGICDDYQGTVSDVDLHTYKTIKIGEQWWMAENLKTTKYKDGTAIPTGLSSGTDGEWCNTTEVAYAVYDDNSSNADIYGNLYNWYAVENQQVCMEGWHVPTNEEWTVLADYLGGTSVAGGKMKETGTSHWNSPNTGATNESDFTGLPAGNRETVSGFYHSMGTMTYFWSSSVLGINAGWSMWLHSSLSKMGKSNINKQAGYSIRCLGD